MSYRVIVPEPVQKQIDRLPSSVGQRVAERIAQLATEPRPPGVKKLKRLSNEYRIRVSDYRIRYEISDRELIILIVSCLHRRDAYRN